MHFLLLFGKVLLLFKNKILSMSGMDDVNIESWYMTTIEQDSSTCRYVPRWAVVRVADSAHDLAELSPAELDGRWSSRLCSTVQQHCRCQDGKLYCLIHKHVEDPEKVKLLLIFCINCTFEHQILNVCNLRRFGPFIREGQTCNLTPAPPSWYQIRIIGRTFHFLSAYKFAALKCIFNSH